MKRGIVSMAVAGLLLAGCTGGRGGGPVGFHACPETGFVREASRVTRFASADVEPVKDNVVSRAALDSLGGECSMDDEGRLKTKVEFMLYAKKGPAASEGLEKEVFRYFAAVLDRHENVLNREVLAAKIEYDDGVGRSEESLIIEIPHRAGDDVSAYKIVVGLELTRDQLEYNRKGPAQ